MHAECISNTDEIGVVLPKRWLDLVHILMARAITLFIGFKLTVYFVTEYKEIYVRFRNLNDKDVVDNIVCIFCELPHFILNFTNHK